MSLPYMPIYWGDYLADTRHLDCTEHGAYLLLLAYQWSTGNPLPLEQTQCDRIAQAYTPHQSAAVGKVLSAYFQKTDKGYINTRLQGIRTDIEAKISKKTAAGKAAAQARWGNNKRNANASKSQCERNTNQNQNQNQNKEKELTNVSSKKDATRHEKASPSKRREHQMPDGWLDSDESERCSLHPASVHPYSSKVWPDSSPAAVYSFNNFSEEYPNKLEVYTARQEWFAENLHKERVAIMDGLDRWKKSEDWKKADGAFIPSLANFLKKRRWIDDPRSVTKHEKRIESIEADKRASAERAKAEQQAIAAREEKLNAERQLEQHVEETLNSLSHDHRQRVRSRVVELNDIKQFGRETLITMHLANMAKAGTLIDFINNQEKGE